MQRIILAVFIGISIAVYFLFNRKPNERYMHWYRPWLLFVFILFALVFLTKAILFISSFILWDPFYLEIIYSCFIALLWIIIKFIIKKFGIDEVCLKLLYKLNSDRYAEKEKGGSNYLAWPYYNLPDGEILLKAGTGVFRFLFLFMGILVLFLYMISIFFQDKLPITIPTGSLLPVALVFIEWFLYLTSDKEIMEDEGDIIEPEPERIIDYEKLWNKFLSTFPSGFSSAFIKSNDQKYEELKSVNDKMIKDLLVKFTQTGCDIIASDLNMSNSFYKFSRILLESLNRGGNILILTEIPAHFKIDPNELNVGTGIRDTERDMVEIFAEYLSQTIQKQIPTSNEILKIHYYDASKVADADSRRIILTSVSNMLNNYLIDSKWIKNLELLVVFNFYDSCLSTLSDNRQFSILLSSIQADYKTLIFTPLRNDIHAGLEHTWMLEKPEELRFNEEVQALKSYFIGFNFEKWRDNWNCIARPLTGNAIVSGLELTTLPIEEHIKHIHIFEASYTEFKEGKENLSVYKNLLNNDLTNINQNAIEKCININLLPIAVSSAGGCSEYDRQHFSLIFDAENNAPKIYNKYAFLGKEENFVLTLTKPHLFRDYFYSNFLFFKNNPVEAIQPQLSKSRINLSLQLITLLRNNPVNKESITNLFSQYGITGYSSVHEVISDLFLEYFNYNIKDNFALRYNCENDFYKGKYCKRETYSINDQIFNDQNEFKFLKLVSIVDNAENILFEISMNLVFQNFLPGQNILLNGRPYLFENFTTDGPRLQVRKTETKNVLFYKPEYKITFGNDSEEADLATQLYYYRHGNKYNLTLRINEGRINVETSGFFEFISAYNSPLADEKQPNRYDLSTFEQSMVRRSYKKGRILELKWELLPDFAEKKDKITTMLHLLLYESMKVFYPYHHQYIIICSDSQENQKARKTVPWIYPNFIFTNPIEGNYSDKCCTLYIVEDSFTDLGILKSFQRNFDYIMKHLFDLMVWYDEDPDNVLHDTTQYQENITDRSAFLKYGIKKEIFDGWDLMKDFMDQHLPFDNEILYELSRGRKALGLETIVVCDFCQQTFTLNQVITLNDGLHRCHECSKMAIDTLEQGKGILEEAMQLYKDHLGIDMNKYTFEFVALTARELHELNGIEFNPTTKFDTRKLVGQAWDLEHDKLYFEKGYQKEPTLMTIIHELCHIWEYNELNCNQIRRDTETAYIMEGLSVWAEINLMRWGGYEGTADTCETSRINEESDYGIGFRYIKEHYHTDNPFEQIKKHFSK